MSREGAIGYCNGKVCYTKKDAQTKRNFLSRHRNKRGRKTQILRVYQCDECDFWHLTKKI